MQKARKTERLETDLARTHYNRPTGQLGIHMDVYSAKSDSSRKFGSEQYFMMSLTDKLFETFRDGVQLDRVKGAFERRSLFDDVIIEGFHRGINITLSLGFNKVSAVDDVYATYKTGVIGEILQPLLIDESVLKAVQAQEVTLRCTMFDEEFSACRDEILNGAANIISDDQKENCRQMIQLVKDYQKQMSADILCLNDELSKTEACLGELIFILKRNVPENIEQISTYKQFLTITSGLRDRKDINQNPINQFKKTIAMAISVLRAILIHVIDRLMQVHTALETTHQVERKRAMKRSALDMLKKLNPEYNLSKLKHPIWQEKVLRREQHMFLGFVSLWPIAVDTVKDIDHNLDEYMSAINNP